MKKMIRTMSVALICAAALLPAAPAKGSMSLPGGDTVGGGAFEEVNYGMTGLAYVSPFLYVGDVATTKSPAEHDTATLLSYSYSYSGLGTPLMTMNYSITNTDATNFSDLRFMLRVQPDGSGTWMDTAKVTWGVKMAGDPDHYQIIDFSVASLGDQIISDNTLKDTDACGGASCDAEFGLQWNLATLAPGDSWLIAAGLAEDGATLSSRYLEATSTDSEQTVLTFSGNASVVPVPGAVILLASGLAGLGLLRRRG